MRQIPLSDSANQSLSIMLGGQACVINLYTAGCYGMFCDLYVSDVLLLGGVVCQNLNRMVRDAWLGFAGDLVFQDTQGAADPASPGLGTRFLLWYLEAADVAALP
ncbi:hypothetical protein GALL_207750 [mine drainage metagenome]|uniref:Cyanophage baseplate Pam3 plug gp18 domain-containing protein n=1 Tax=mine drainage metagenome TaxID=410659 RepID=A0A1J5SAF6_9ZZZZ